MNRNIISDYIILFIIIITIRNYISSAPELNRYYGHLDETKFYLVWAALIAAPPMLIGFLHYRSIGKVYEFLQRPKEFPPHLYVLFVAMVMGLFEVLIHIVIFGDTFRRIIISYVFDFLPISEGTSSILFANYAYAVVIIWLGLTLGMRISSLFQDNARHI